MSPVFKNNKVPLIYILSNGRSGTTLLDLLLGAHPKIWTLGEAQNLPWELRNPRAPCGCGNPVPESEFWAPIIDSIPTEIDGYHIGYFRNEKQVGKVLRWDMLPDVLRGEVSSRWQEAAREYAIKNQHYFEVVYEAAQDRSPEPIRWFVDASKDPYRLFWLQASGLFDIRVIHMLKDPRALVYSMARDWIGNPVDGINRTIRYTARWIIENAIMAHLCRVQFSAADTWTQRYESLASHPEETLTQLGNWLGVKYSPSLVHDFRKYENFAISGNMMRWRESDSEINLDERWKSDLPSSYARFIRLATQPFHTLCGYESSHMWTDQSSSAQTSSPAQTGGSVADEIEARHSKSSVGSSLVFQVDSRSPFRVGQPIVVASHPRSGTHLTIDLLRKQFESCKASTRIGETLHHLYLNLDAMTVVAERYDVGDAIGLLQRAQTPTVKTHSLPTLDMFSGAERALAEQVLEKSVLIYVARDCRDVICSMYQWERSRHESFDATLSWYLRNPLGRNSYAAERDQSGMTYLEKWVEHVNAWRSQSNVLLIRFEDILSHPEKIITTIARHTGLEPLYERPLLPQKIRYGGRLADYWRRLTGYQESTAVLGRKPEDRALNWHEEFSKEDRQYIDQIAGDLLIKLGYESGDDWI